ncbi:hypothetical protein NLM31_36830 [Bradyrhizobium sp. CCGUVB4N]|uniref:hypothetical protein n=1 Tax=Bradyrhizobium sp. CCGUVB4N TaxID=2949631 RepID=UPI0020B2A9F5|nr:hypothetical protein [Bradyrhizobium sp. CCGUVB4N]MCP3385968.1 hypothetical protein [Bradyrhizobium sp. CCGUVB4N]
MLDFNSYVSRHGEFGVQALIEQIEQMAGIRVNIDAPLPLEVRWKIVMQRPMPQQQAMAA